MVAVMPEHARQLPHDEIVEERLLGTCLLDGPTVIPQAIMAGIKPTSFYVAAAGTVFSVILDLYTAAQPTTLDIVASELKKRRQLDAVGGYSYLLQISERVPTHLEAPSFIATVRGYALRRAIIRSRTTSIEQAYESTACIDELVASLTAQEQAVLGDSAQNNELSVAEVAEGILADLKLPKGQRKGLAGRATWGIRDLDERCGKMAPGDLVVLAGMPSSGKSALADMSAWANAAAGLNVVLFSYEMSVEKKVVRIAQQISRLNIKDFDLAPKDKQLQFTEAVRKVRDCKTLHIFTRDTTLNRVLARVRAVHQKQPVGMIVIDFLQYLARLEPSLKNESMVEKLGRLTSGLKALGADVGAPVLLLSSLNREGYKAGGTGPTMANLKASGEIESDADIVMLLNWPAKNPITGADQDPHDASQGTFYVDCVQDKGRDNGVNKVGVMFTRSATRFDPIARGGPDLR